MNEPQTQIRQATKKVVLIALVVALFFIGSGIYYYVRYQKETIQQEAFVDYQGAVQRYTTPTQENVDFYKASKDLEELLQQYPDTFSSRDEAFAKVMLGDSLGEIDRVRGTEILKDVVRNPKYPDGTRSLAINYIVNDYELDFIDRNFVKETLFVGEEFAHLLSDSGGDEDIAIRKLNERSVALSPNAIANYRIAKWYAAEIYLNPGVPESKRNEYFEKMNEHVAAGDQLLAQYENTMTPQRRGLAYELKARIIHLSGGNIGEAELLFQKALKTYKEPPITIFQRVYDMRSSFYYAAFLARNPIHDRAEDLRNLLKFHLYYFSTSWEPRERNVRIVSFLIAARDAADQNYPDADFDKRDIELFRKIYPDLGAVIDKLDFREYVKGHPLELKLKQ